MAGVELSVRKIIGVTGTARIPGHRTPTADIVRSADVVR
jgi:hypothetical protein